MTQRSSVASEPALGALHASSRSIRPRNESVAFSFTLTARSSSIAHSVAIHDQPMTAPSFSARTRPRKRALRQPPAHQSGTGFPAALQRCATSERFVSAAAQTRCSISVESGRRVNVFTVPAATAASQSCTHFPVELFQTLSLSSAALTPRYFFNQTRAGAAMSWSNSLTLKVGTTGDFDRNAKSYSRDEALGSRRASYAMRVDSISRDTTRFFLFGSPALSSQLRVNACS